MLLLVATMWLIVRNLAIRAEATLPRWPEAVLWLPTGEERMDRSGIEDMPAFASPSPAVLAELLDALGDAPLAAEPFYARALALAHADPARAIVLMAEARRRVPRSVVPRLFLIDHYIRAGRLGDAAGEAVSTLGLGGATTAQLLQLLLLLDNTPAGHDAIARALAGRAVLRDRFLRYAADHGADPSRLFHAMQPGSGNSGSAARSSLVQQLLARNDLARAYLAWINFLPASALGKVASVYDGSFAGLPGAPPFNWVLTSGDAATADTTSSGDFPGGSALDVDYFGERGVEIARQLLVLPPGQYVFSYMASGAQGKVGGGALRWQIGCAGTPKTSLLAVATLPPEPGRVQATFTVPAQACEGQWLQLVGVPGDIANTISASYSGVAIARR